MRIDDLAKLGPDARRQVRAQLATPAKARSVPVDRERLTSVLHRHLRTMATDIPPPTEEYHFAREVVPGINPRPRRYRLDLAWPDVRVGIEVHGAIHGQAVTCHQCRVLVRARRADGSLGGVMRSGGRHTQGKGFDADRRKMNLALALGWVVFEVTGPMLRSGPEWALQVRRTVIERMGHEQRSSAVR